LTGLIENLPAIVFIVITMVLSALIVVVILWMANKTNFRELELDIKWFKFKLKK
jgi:hypothetical protein